MRDASKDKTLTERQRIVARLTSCIKEPVDEQSELRRPQNARREQSPFNRLRERFSAVEAGRPAGVPQYRTLLSLVNPITNSTVLLGRFESNEQALLFCCSGQVRHGKIEVGTVIEHAEGHRAGFFQLNEGQIHHLLAAREVAISHRYDGAVLSLNEDIDFDCDVEVH